MEKVIIKGIAPFDGEYDLDLGFFKMREFNIIKKLSGVRAAELEEAIEAGDTDLILAIAAIAVRRGGKPWEEFVKLAWEADTGAITVEVDEPVVEADAVPLTQSPPNESGNGTEGQPLPSGEISSDGGDDSQATNLRAIGGLS